MSAATATARRQGDLRNYILVTGAYWVETLADGATRMLVLFYFYELGYSAFTVASLFIFYEVFGIVTNLVGGWLAARFGLRTTLFMGLGTQVLATAMVGLCPAAWLVIPYVMTSQAFSGIAKDLTKMSSKSAVKLVVPEGDEGSLYRWVAVLTGSKNALKGVGFFLGAAMLTVFGFQTSMLILAGSVLTTLIVVSTLMHGHLGKPDAKAKFKHMFSNNRAVNVLAAARIFLFASRDVWFVVGLPVYLETVLGWSFLATGGFLAIWVIGYGGVQAIAPRFIRGQGGKAEPEGRTATWLAFVLAVFPAAIAIGLTAGVDPTAVIVVGLIVFGIVFAANSAVHSYLILAYAENDKATMNVGFYYMANAAGRLIGTVLSGLLYQLGGLEACLWTSAGFVLAAALISLLLPSKTPDQSRPADALARRLTLEVSMRYVLFVCTQNAGRSQMAEAFFTRAAPEDLRAESAGQLPATEVHPAVVVAMREVGIDLSDRIPKKLTVEMQLHADWAITLACGGTCPYVPSVVDDWEVADPAGKSLEEVRVIRDDIRERVERLLVHHVDDIRTDRTAHEQRLANLLPNLDRGFSNLRSPQEIRSCADAVLDHFDDVPVRTHVLTLAQRRTAECLRADECYELTTG